MKNILLLLVMLLSACSVFGPAPTPTPTLDPTLWKVFQDSSHHISFAYPRAYDDHPVCILKTLPEDSSHPDFVVSMNNSFLKVTISRLFSVDDTDPQTAVDRLRSDLGGSNKISFEDPVKRTVSGVPALSQRVLITYNQGGYQENTFFKKNGFLYTIFVQTPSNCDGYPNTPTTEEAYQRLLESFVIQ